MQDLNQRLANLSPEKKALLLQRLQQSSNLGASSTGAIAIPTASRQSPLPLSYAQQRLWFLMQLEAGREAYNIPTATRLLGDLDRPALQQVFRKLIERHEILRTRFVLSGHAPIQIVEPHLPLPWQEFDLQSQPEVEQQAQLEILVQTEANHCFDLAELPLLRCGLVQLKPREHVLILTLHHIIFDGWSLGVLFRELTALYQAQLTQQPAQLPPLVVQYGDYAAWQRDWLQGDVLQRQIDYWRQELMDAPPLLELPLDRPRPPIQSFRGQRLIYLLPPDILADLKTFCQHTGSTAFMVLEATFALLMGRYSGQDDILIGTPIANRNRPELTNLIGCLINTIVLRHDLSNNPSFEALIQQVKQKTLAAYQHQDIPFERLVDVLQPDRTLSHNPIFQALFGFTPATESLPPGGELQLAPLSLDITTAKFDLSLLVAEDAQGLSAAWEYNTDLFDPGTIERMAQQFETLLRGALSHPQQAIASMPLLSPAERQQILYDWNATAIPLPEPLGLHQGFEHQVLLTPEAIAVITLTESLTYRELETRANQFAHYLQSQGLSSKTLIGLCIDKSVEMLVGLFGILKAGCVYIPLDPSYPSDRLASMIDDAQLTTIITQTHLLDRLPKNSATVHCLDRDWSTISQQPPTRLNLPVDPDELAYIIYTSGSTGKPKGVMISHRGAVNTNIDINRRFHVTARDRVLGLASLSFDLSVYDIFGVLAVGGAVVFPQPSDNLNPEAWLSLMQQHQVSVWNTAPAVMEMLMGYVTGQQLQLPASLRVVMMSGDAISVSLPEQIWQAGSRAIQIYSLGGATEGSIWSIYYPITEVDSRWTSIPYGKPLTNQRFHILDDHLNPVPIGVAGELHIGGDGVALGYFQRLDLNAVKFINDPFFPGGRLYKTGDRGRYLADGTIQFLGRIDHQVKLRGFRIELGEIEAVLTQQSEVREALVVIQDGQDRRDRRLCAYVVPHPNHTLTVADLRDRLRERLPDYMVPSAIALLEQFPLTANGKIDRKALPIPDIQLTTLKAERILPQTPLEQQIADLWQSLLPVPIVGIHDSFFDIGGNSLLLIQLHSRLQTELGLTCSILDLFQFPTIASLTQYLQQLQSSQDSMQQQTAQRLDQRLSRRQDVHHQRQLRQQVRQTVQAPATTASPSN